MNNLFGKIKAELVEKDQTVKIDLVEKINRNINPPEKVSADNVHIRAMYIVSDQVNSYGGCFPAEEHEKLIELLIDSPVMIGHRKDSLPIARNFHAETVPKEGINWIKVYFYWLKDAEKGEDLKKNIDGGIYKECSISFIFNFPECSICGEDIRKCKHRPFTTYSTSDRDEIEAHFNYRQILKVLETSLVYRGSVKDTSITDELLFTAPPDEALNVNEPQNYRTVSKRIWDLNCLEKDRSLIDNTKYLIMPAYESLSVVLKKSGEKLSLNNYQGDQYETPVISEFLTNLELPDDDYTLDCRLIGYRGKERQPISELLEYIRDDQSSVRRLEIKAVDLLQYNNEPFNNSNAESRYQKLNEIFGGDSKLVIRAGLSSGSELNSCLKKFTTRYGSEIIDCESSESYHYTHKKLIPLIVCHSEKVRNDYRYSFKGKSKDIVLTVNTTIVSHEEFNPGDVIEIEVASIDNNGGDIKLIQPKIFNSLCNHGDVNDLSMLLKPPHSEGRTKKYSIQKIGDNGIILSFEGEQTCHHFMIHNFSSEMLEKGQRFLSDRLDETSNMHQNQNSGSIVNQSVNSEAILLNLDGSLGGEYAIRSVILHGSRRYLFYKRGQVL